MSLCVFRFCCLLVFLCFCLFVCIFVKYERRFNSYCFFCPIKQRPEVKCIFQSKQKKINSTSSAFTCRETLLVAVLHSILITTLPWKVYVDGSPPYISGCTLTSQCVGNMSFGKRTFLRRIGAEVVAVADPVLWPPSGGKVWQTGQLGPSVTFGQGSVLMVES